MNRRRIMFVEVDHVEPPGRGPHGHDPQPVIELADWPSSIRAKGAPGGGRPCLRRGPGRPSKSGWVAADGGQMSARIAINYAAHRIESGRFENPGQKHAARIGECASQCLENSS